VPRTVAITVARTATWTLVTSASVRSWKANGSFQCSSVNPCQTKLKRLCVSLNEKSRMIAIGTIR
jgi:hypothetical protein